MHSFIEFARAVKWIWRPTKAVRKGLGVPDALHPVEIVCYCAVKFGLVILGLSKHLVILFRVKISVQFLALSG